MYSCWPQASGLSPSWLRCGGSTPAARPAGGFEYSGCRGAVCGPLSSASFHSLLHFLLHPWNPQHQLPSLLRFQLPSLFGTGLIGT